MGTSDPTTAWDPKIDVFEISPMMGSVVDLAYIAMDEPLWYGHHFHGTSGCQAAPEYLARQIAGELKGVREIFPDVKVGDVEPIAPPQPADWTDQVLAWTRTWRQITGEPFDFVRADVAWTGPWRRELPALKHGLRTEHVKYSLIYDGGGDGRTQTDAIWTETAAERFRMVEADPQMAPEQAVIQTWVRWPAHMLPETQRGTLTNLLLQYLSLPPSEHDPIEERAALPAYSQTPAVQMHLIRQYKSADCISGQLSVGGLIVYTLERPWEGNIPPVAAGLVDTGLARYLRRETRLPPL